MFLLESLKKFAETDKIALINREEVVSYADMERRSEAFAAWLVERYGDDKSPVIIYGHKESYILPCIYGALKAGHPYIPLDVTVPPDRAQGITEEAKPCCAVDFYGVSLPTEVVNCDSLEQIFTDYANHQVPHNRWVAGGDTAYILFTSGSTGRPKGVPITYSNIENLYVNFDGWMASEGSVILNQISYSFDVSVCSIWLGVARGMTLYTIDKEMLENYSSLFEHLEKSNVAVWVSTPSFAEMCVPSNLFSGERLQKIEKFVFCGEVLTHKLVGELFARFPSSKVINTYGPTEATVLVTAVEVTKEHAADENSIPIGYPLNEVALRLDGDGQLLIVSDSVSDGYLNRPDLTAKAFFIDDETGIKGYKTGDLCHQNNGLYYYLGRMDNQLKVNGYRVEIEDIENNLVKVENVSRASVLPVYEGEKVAYLAAFVVLQQPDGLTSLKRAAKVKEELKMYLPSYMIPRRIVAIDSFPLNTNGKIDRKQLATKL